METARQTESGTGLAKPGQLFSRLEHYWQEKTRLQVIHNQETQPLIAAEETNFRKFTAKI
jgi:hypothetical protein